MTFRQELVVGLVAWACIGVAVAVTVIAGASVVSQLKAMAGF